MGTGKAGDKLLLQPTKTQNKRHHINSLVMKAAETELALMDVRGGRGRTKAETQVRKMFVYFYLPLIFNVSKAKYGW